MPAWPAAPSPSDGGPDAAAVAPLPSPAPAAEAAPCSVPASAGGCSPAAAAAATSASPAAALSAAALSSASSAAASSAAALSSASSPASSRTPLLPPSAVAAAEAEAALPAWCTIRTLGSTTAALSFLLETRWLGMPAWLSGQIDGSGWPAWPAWPLPRTYNAGTHLRRGQQPGGGPQSRARGGRAALGVDGALQSFSSTESISLRKRSGQALRGANANPQVGCGAVGERAVSRWRRKQHCVCMPGLRQGLQKHVDGRGAPRASPPPRREV